MEKQQEFERMLTITELSELTGLTISYIRKAMYNLQLPYYKFGPKNKNRSQVRFRMSEIESWIKQRKTIRKSS